MPIFLQCVNNRYEPEIHFDPRGYCVVNPIDADKVSFEMKDNISHETAFQMTNNKHIIFQSLLDQKYH